MMRSAWGISLVGHRLFGDTELLPVSLPMSLGGLLLPVFHNGFLTVIESDHRTVKAINRDGTLISTVRISLPGTAKLLVYAATATSRAGIVAAASVTDTEGRVASLLVFTSPDGKLERVVRTTPFAAAQVAFLADGRLLCVGREHDTEYKEVAGHSILRFYSHEGTLLSKSLAVDSLRAQPRDLHPMSWLLRLGTDRIGLMDRKTFQYIEVDGSGSVVRPLGPVGSSPGVTVNGLAILPNGDRLLSTTGSESYGVERVRYSNGSQISTKALSSIKLPQGIRGLGILGTLGSEVAALTIPTKQLVFFDEALAS
jgi:hypothetical protein